MSEMEFSGSFDVEKEAGFVLALFKVPSILGKCIYGVESIDFQENTFECRVRFDLSSADVSYMSNISGKLKGAISYSDIGFKIIGSGRAAGTRMTFNLDVQVAEHEKFSKVHWRGSFDFGLMIKIMGTEKVRMIAQENIENTIENLKKAIEK